jgi:hypothetical protein
MLHCYAVERGTIVEGTKKKKGLERNTEGNRNRIRFLLFL